jgi:DNA adenine methylase
MISTSNKIKPPITYYGGKQKLVSKILPLIPEHTLYSEPFIGGGAVFWAKPASEIEVINDTNRELINFYEVCKNDFVDLEKRIRISLHSRSLHSDARVINQNPHMFSRLDRAWAIWVLAMQSFSSILDGGWGYDKKKNSTGKKIHNRRSSFSEEIAIRLQNTQIECTDALRIISSRDAKESFFYCDPPYFNSDCGHYDGYSKEDFEMLLKTLSKLEGKFLLSSYPSPVLQEYTKEFGWHQKNFSQQVTVASYQGKRKPKVEVLTANYDLNLG